MSDNFNDFKNEEQLFLKKKDNKKNGMKLKIKTFFNYFIIGILVVVVFCAGYFTHYCSIGEELRSISFLINAYKNNYYKAQDGSVPDLIVDALMDQYSEYYTKEEYQKQTSLGNGLRDGYGFSITDLIFTVVCYNSPAEISGLKVGDLLKGYKINGNGDYQIPLKDSDFTDATEYLTSNDTLNLLIERNSIEIEISMKKSVYTETYVRYVDQTGTYAFLGEEEDINFERVGETEFELASGWSYLKFTRFNGRLSGLAGASGQFERALDEFKKNGNKKIIIDLRSNGGGYMSILCEVASHLCYDGESDGKSLLCQVAISKDGSKENYKTKATDYLSYGFEKIVFLANSGTASAAEALMGAVLDYDKKSGYNIVNVVLDGTQTQNGVVYKTYGKGIMQSSLLNVPTGEVLKLTTAQMYWPVYGHTIHGVGLTPETDPRILATQGDAIIFAQTL